VPKQAAADFASYRISSQKMLDGSLIVGTQAGRDLGRIEIDLRQAQ
jgi:hypothetical protein